MVRGGWTGKMAEEEKLKEEGEAEKMSGRDMFEVLLLNVVEGQTT